MNKKISRLVFVILALQCACCWTSAFAQKNAPPSGQFGVGLYVNNSVLAEPPGGMSFTFAINHSLQIGSYFALDVVAGDIGSITAFELQPFVRYVIDASVSPFFQGGLNVNSWGGTTGIGLFLGGGLAYYLNQTFGIHAEMDVMQIGFSPSGIIFGFSNVKAGVDWYMGK